MMGGMHTMKPNTNPQGEGASEALRAEFVRLLTQDGETTDARRKEFNQAIFDPDRGYAIWNGTDLDMVLSKFDKAVKNVYRR